MQIPLALLGLPNHTQIITIQAPKSSKKQIQHPSSTRPVHLPDTKRQRDCNPGTRLNEDTTPRNEEAKGGLKDLLVSYKEKDDDVPNKLDQVFHCKLSKLIGLTKCAEFRLMAFVRLANLIAKVKLLLLRENKTILKPIKERQTRSLTQELKEVRNYLDEELGLGLGEEAY
ncbi:hypothetical protein Tco_0178862 [Tanacetum coccineum]